MQTLQKLFYRVSKQGADVFRIDLQNRLRRLDLQKIADIHLTNKTISQIKGIDLSSEEQSDMQNWLKMRQDQLELRSQNDINRLIESLNHAANWVENQADDEQISQIGDPVLMAMHDLRATIIRKMTLKKTTGGNND